MNSPLNNTKPIDDGFDRQNVTAIRKRFMRVNSDRLARLRSGLSDRQQLFMDTLTLLFHCNHPMLPGFVSRDAPARVSHFKPSKHDLLMGRTLARSFTLSYDPSLEADILGIYIMGSVGTIAQNEGSDLDIWICYRPELDKKQLAQLDKKCTGISAWAETIRLEANFFLMDYHAFKAGKFSSLDNDSSGSAQQLLLLDEFYRSAIFIAGRSPLWWHVPSQEEEQYNDYVNTLLKQRFLPLDSVIDFGGVAAFPAGEFLGAGIWQLYKAIESPYKSVLKLLLLEVYAAEHPNTRPLSLTFKAMIYNGQFDINKFDSYLMIYQRIEDYLITQQQQHRLDLVRKCFYFKVNKALSKPPRQVKKSWQRNELEALVAQWSWSLEYIKYLDGRAQWNAAQVNNEFQLLVDELNHGYRSLLKFAKSYGKARSISRNELLLLGRKLQAAFNHRPGKINFINPGISNNIRESKVFISRQVFQLSPKNKTPTQVWTAFSTDQDAYPSQKTALQAGTNCVELLLWCYCNGVINTETQLEIDIQNDDNFAIGKADLKRIIVSLSQWLPLPLASPKHTHFQQSSIPQSVLFLVNVGKANEHYHHMSEVADALCYGSSAENLIQSVDMVVKNNWNEINIDHFEGPDSLLNTICEFLKMTFPGTHQQPPIIQVRCIGNDHVATINQRLDRWIKDIRQCFFSGMYSKRKRFIFQLAKRYCCLQFKGMNPNVASFNSCKHLIEHLRLEQAHYSPIAVDNLALRGHPLHLIAKHSSAASVDVFYRRLEHSIEIYLVDENGSVAHNVTRAKPSDKLLKSLSQFLRAVLTRQLHLNSDLHTDFGRLPLNFFELFKDKRGLLQCHTRAIAAHSDQSNNLDVKAVAREAHNARLTYDFFCDGKAFSAASYGNTIELAVGELILKQRQSGESYPIYISDLDLSAVAEHIASQGILQVVHYYQIKTYLEMRLNHAIGKLRNA